MFRRTLFFAILLGMFTCTNSEGQIFRRARMRRAAQMQSNYQSNPYQQGYNSQANRGLYGNRRTNQPQPGVTYYYKNGRYYAVQNPKPTPNQQKDSKTTAKAEKNAKPGSVMQIPGAVAPDKNSVLQAQAITPLENDQTVIDGPMINAPDAPNAEPSILMKSNVPAEDKTTMPQVAPNEPAPVGLPELSAPPAADPPSPDDQPTANRQFSVLEKSGDKK